ncbi:MAG TPA: transporter, partial [Jatrophihabitans sp.]|nr:transporter [Jatrophihabitans sp.]
MTRALLVGVCVLLIVVALIGMRRGWRNRALQHAGLPPLPTPPADLGEASLVATGLYVGTTPVASWQDRGLHAGLGARAAAALHLYPAGL